MFTHLDTASASFVRTRSHTFKTANTINSAWTLDEAVLGAISALPNTWRDIMKMTQNLILCSEILSRSRWRASG